MGSVTISASFHTATATAALTVSSESVSVSSMVLSSDSGSTLHGEAGSTYGTTLDVVLEDGTEYDDIEGIDWLPASEIVAYSSGALDVSVAVGGSMTLLDNHYEAVRSRRDGVLASVSDSVSVAANLKAAFREVDLGANVGLQFDSSGGYVYVPVLVNSGSDKLTSFQIVVEFDDALLLAVGYSEGVGYDSQATDSFSAPTVTLNDPTTEALLVGNKDGAVAPRDGAAATLG